MTAVAPASSTETSSNQLAILFQYTIEVYKTFEKLAENLPNPMSAATFKNFAEDERELRDLLEIKYRDAGSSRIRVTLGADLRFQDMLEGDLSYREIAELLLNRERTMEKRLVDFAKNGAATDRNLFRYIAATKRAHVVYLERELELIRVYPDWFRREDGETIVVHGKPE